MGLDKQERAVAATQPGPESLAQGKGMPATPTVAADPHLAGRPVMSLKEQKDLMKDGKLVGYHCTACKLDRIDPMVRCPKCGSTDIARREFSKTGTVVSYTIQSVASDQFLNETPFAFALVKLDDGPTMSGWIPWIAKEKDLPLGQAVVYTPSYKPGIMFEKK